MTRIVVCLIGSLIAFQSLASTDFQKQKVNRKAILNEYVLQFSTEKRVQSLPDLFQRMNFSFIQAVRLKSQEAGKVLFSRKEQQGKYKTLVHFKQNQIEPLLWSKIKSHPLVASIHPNYLYEGELREEVVAEPVVNDEKFSEQYHHSVTENPLAWDLLSKTIDIVVAVTDDGVDLKHEDLQENIWINESEIPDNDIDDDMNGYIDDVQGWDFADNDNNPSPTFGSHGTHVAGIISAVADNNVGVVGTAPHVAKIMPLRFFGGSFTSATVAETYRYAADNGAHIITTSYNIDYFVGDAVFEEAIAYVYDQGLLHFNSAGNGYSSGPSRKVFQELILVCSTIADGDENHQDRKSGFSNYGAGIDLCAPGGGGDHGILSTIPYNQYSRKSGTSMAAPNAAAVAALIWSHHPTWSREQVVAQLFSTSENIDNRNPGYKGQLGAGRVNSYLALSTPVLDNPGFSAIDEISQQKVEKGISQFSVRFSQLLDPKTVTKEAFKLFGPQGEVDVSIGRSYKVGSNEVLLAFNELSAGDYRLYIKPSLKNPFGQAFDGDEDGQSGGEKLIEFSIDE